MEISKTSVSIQKINTEVGSIKEVKVSETPNQSRQQFQNDVILDITG